MSVQPTFADPEPVVEIQRPIVLRFQGLMPRNLWRFAMHDKRRGGDLSHIDPELTRHNEVLFGDRDWIPQLRAEVAEARSSNHEARLDALRAKSRRKEAEEVEQGGPADPWRASDHGPLREGILTVNKLWFGGTAHDRWDPTKVQQFRAKAMAFLQQHFPDGQLRYASGHVDEEAYHLHFVVATWTEKVTANRGHQFLLQPSLNPLIASYEQAQDIAGEAFAELGIIRGERRAGTIRAAKAAGEAAPKRRCHIPPSTHRKMEQLEAYVQAGKVRKMASEDAAVIIGAAEGEATEIRRQAAAVGERAEARAEITRRDALAGKAQILVEARDTGASVIRKSRKQAIADASARKAEMAREEEQHAGRRLEMIATQARREGRGAAQTLRQHMLLRSEQRRSEAAAERARLQQQEAERAVVAADLLVSGYEARAERATLRMEAAQAGRLAAEQERDRVLARARLEAIRMEDAALARQEACAALHDLHRESYDAEAKLASLVTDVGRAELRLAAAIEGADAVELGVGLVATGALHIDLENDQKPELVWGEGAPLSPVARIALLEAVRPAEPILLRIARMAKEIVRSLLTRERRKLAEDAVFVMSLNDNWTEEQRARLGRISDG